MDDDWPTCDAEAAVAVLSARYRFSLPNAVQLLRDQGILRPLAEAGRYNLRGEAQCSMLLECLEHVRLHLLEHRSVGGVVNHVREL